MSKVNDHLYISDIKFAASSASDLRQHGITHIVNMTYENENAFPDEFSYLRIPAKDGLSERLGPRFRDIAAFTAEAKEKDGVALIHCAEGISRSSTAVLASLMINDEMRLKDAFELLQKASAEAEPNTAFLRELRRLEKDLYGDYCKEKLTPQDDDREVRQLDLEESVKVVMASAALSGTSLEERRKELKCILYAFKEAKKEDRKTMEELVSKVVVSGLESFAADSERDKRAREALAKLLTIGLPSDKIYELSDLKEMLTHLSESEEFEGLKLDAPRADSWIQQVVEYSSQ